MIGKVMMRVFRKFNFYCNLLTEAKVKSYGHLTLFGPGFSQLLKTGGRGGKMTHRHNSCISSQMKLKLGINIIWIMLT